jgi:phospholipase C
MPNRLCTLTGKTPILDNFSPDDTRVGYLTDPTIFDFLTRSGVSWAYYEQDIAFLRLFDRYRLDDRNVLPLAKEADRTEEEFSEDEIFFSRLANGKLPAVTFIDPDFIDVPPDRTANDDHPPADVSNGQELVRQIYNALVRSPQWGKILFVLTYDEHGGFFDHVPPPGTKFSPEGENVVPKVNEDGPAFYGVRVPTFVISPWVDATGDSTLFDHTSIIKTILLRFNNGVIPTVFGERVQQANHLGMLLTRDTPRLDVPIIESITFPAAQFVNESENEPVLADYHEVIQRFTIP